MLVPASGAFAQTSTSQPGRRRQPATRLSRRLLSSRPCMAGF